MLNITVEGVYESDTGSGQKQYEGFSYEFKISKPVSNGINTHVQRRFIPYLISKDKKKAGKIFSRLHSCLITNIQESEDNKNSIIGKDIKKMDDWEIQDLACLFDLYEIPLPNTFSINELRDKAIIAYFKKVLKVPMNTPKDIEKLDFIKINPDGSFKLNIEGEVKADVPPEYFVKAEKKEGKKGLGFFLDKVFTSTKDETQNDNIPEEGDADNGIGNDGFPSEQDLIQ